MTRIIAQPFLLGAQAEAAVRCHVPDFLLLSHTGPTAIVDVESRFQLSKPKVSFTLAWTLAWTKDVVEQRGWRCEVWTREEVRLQAARMFAQ